MNISILWFFLTESVFTGLGQNLSYLTTALLIFFSVSKTAENMYHIPLMTIIDFVINSIFSISSILWTNRTTQELPLMEAPKEEIKKSRQDFVDSFQKFVSAFREIPMTMKQMIPMIFFK
ncbi:MAG: hypothetical protein ACMUEM_06140 [Flavobacteriales bacterium AspAUS03]